MSYDQKCRYCFGIGQKVEMSNKHPGDHEITGVPPALVARPLRSPDWIKVKNRNYPAMKRVMDSLTREK